MSEAKRRPRWYAAGTVLQGTRLLVIRYTRLGRTSIKFAGGSEKFGNGSVDESVEATLCREFVDEALVSGKVTEHRLVHTQRPAPDHEQAFSLVSYEGELRIETKIDKEEGKPDEILSPPFFMEVKDLIGSIFPSHRPALEAIIRLQAQTSAEWGWIALDLGLA